MTTTPPLWPGFQTNHPGYVASAWAEVWNQTADGPALWRDIVEIVHGEYPMLTIKTISNLIHQGVGNGHLERTGTYHRDPAIDTRTVTRAGANQ